jgi:peptidoglycan/LPS O-acetylase OafA/YrhL
MNAAAAPGQLRAGAPRVDATRASLHFDLVRGLAAVAVLIYHVRYRFFLDYKDLGARDSLSLAWYTLTSFGHDAVMVFFVLSGFLVGGTVIRAFRERRWNPRHYVLSRATRLYVVLVPALALTLFWDQLGLHWFGHHTIYTGVAAAYRHDFFNVASRSGIRPIVGNLLFMQTITVPPFGSNDALWSLAFEGWYYVMFPLAAVVGLSRSSAIRRITALAILVFVVWAVGKTIAWYSSLWLLGAMVAILPTIRLFHRGNARWLIVVGLAVVGWVALTHVSSIRAALGGALFNIDASIALAFALWLYICVHDRAPLSSGLYARAARTLAGGSYTLYAVHLPLLVFLRAWLVPSTPWSPTPSRIAAALGITIMAATYAYGLAAATERRTDGVRRWIAARLEGRPAR